MSTQAQVLANRANAQHSSGPRTEAGKTAVAQNNFRHGLSGAFQVLPSEDAAAFNAMQTSLIEEHQPSTITESIFLQKMAQSFWLSQRAVNLQNSCFTGEPLSPQQEKPLALYLRYQTTHDRAFHQALNNLLKLRSQMRKAEIGFESQQRQQEQHTRKLAVEKRKQDLHKLDLILAEAKLDHQILLNRNTQPVSDRASLDVMRHILVRKAA